VPPDTTPPSCWSSSNTGLGQKWNICDDSIFSPLSNDEYSTRTGPDKAPTTCDVVQVIVSSPDVLRFVHNVPATVTFNVRFSAKILWFLTMIVKVVPLVCGLDSGSTAVTFISAQSFVTNATFSFN